MSRAPEPAPKVRDDDMVIVQDVPGLVANRGTRLETLAIIALFTGMRLGEVFALRWGRVDLAGNVIMVREALEQTKAHGVRFKAPKSKAGRRDITLPTSWPMRSATIANDNWKYGCNSEQGA